MKRLTCQISTLIAIIILSLPQAGCADCAQSVKKSVEPALAKIQAGTASGSGVIIDKSGYVLTAYHLIENSQTTTITFSSGDKYDADVIWKDKDRGLAILQLTSPPKQLPTVAIGDSERIRAGDNIVAMSYSLEMPAISGGKVVSLGADTALRYIQTDVAVNPGDSGGPVANCAGEIIGIASGNLPAAASDKVTAIAVNQVKSLIDKLIQEGLPLIQKVEIPAESITRSSAMVKWETSRTTRGVVRYGINQQLNLSTADDNFSGAHSLSLTGLEAETTYQLVIVASDGDNIESRATSAVSFRTAPKGPAAAVAVPNLRLPEESIKLSKISDKSVTIEWVTEKPAIGRVSYGLTPSYGSEMREQAPSSRHSITISSLIPNTTYYYKVISGSPQGEAESKGNTFTTLKQTCNKVGCLAPGFNLPTLNEDYLGMDNFQGKKLVIMLTKTACETCMRQIMYLQEASDSLPGADFTIVLISSGEPREKVRSALRSHGISLPALLDNDGSVVDAYRPVVSPCTYFLDKDHVIRIIKSSLFGSRDEAISLLKSF